MNKVNDVELLYEYFISQSHLDPTNTYANNVAQNGTGVGNFLGGLIRTILPIIRKTSMAIGNELVKNSVSRLNNGLIQNIGGKKEQASCRKRKVKSVLESSNKKPRLKRGNSNLIQKEKSKKKKGGRNKINKPSKKSLQSLKGPQRSKLSTNKKEKKTQSKKAKITKNKGRLIKREKDIFSDI
jgi:hypothetical protein